MKFRTKTTGVLPKIIHNPAEYALKGLPLQVIAAAAEENGTVPDRLVLYVKNGGKYEMTPVDTLETPVNSYEIYSVTVPASETEREEFSYALAEEGILADITDYYTVPMYSENGLPEPPALCLTELYERPKGTGLTAYFELMNPGKSDVDLFDYEVLIYARSKAAEGKPTCRLPLADSAGTVLHPGEFAAIWGLVPKNFGFGGRDRVTPGDFAELFNAEYNNRENKIALDGIDGRSIRIIPVDWTCTDPVSGKRKLKKGIGEIPVKHFSSVFTVVPKGGNAGDEVYSCIYSTVYGSWDTPVKRSSYWTVDMRNPSVGICQRHYGEPTPGYPAAGQRAPSAGAQVPLIIPVCPVARVYLGDGNCDLSFAVVSEEPESVSFAAYVSFGSGKEAVRFAATERDDGLFHAEIPLKYFEFSESFGYTITVSDGIRSTSTEEEPINVPIFDNAGPRIVSMIPTEKYVYDMTAAPAVSVKWTDVAGTDIARCRIEIDGKNMTSSAEWTDGGMTLPLKAEKGEHRLKLVLFDAIGNRTERNVSFGLSDMSELCVYRGEVHAHTSESDGTGMPSDAYAYARDVGKVDYFAVTDHSHYIDDAKYDNLIKTADSFDEPGRFAALYGFEMTWNKETGYWGHLNVLGTEDYVCNIQENSLPDMYEWLSRRPEAVAMFNHPGYPWGDFDEYAHKTESAVKSVALSEIKGMFYDFEYGLMLSKGWKAAPVSNEDNHGADWTTATRMSGCVLAPALTRQNIMDAMKAGRTYTTSDSTMKILYRVNGAWLGSTLVSPEKLCFDIDIRTEAAKGIGLVEIIGRDGIVVASRNPGVAREFTWKPVLEPDFDYYYLRITGKDQYCVTSPVYIEGRNAPVIESISFNASYNPVDTVAASVVIKNDGDGDLADVRANFIPGVKNGLKLNDAEPFKTAHIGKLKAGCKATVSVLLPEIPGNRTVYVTVSGERGKRKVMAEQSAMMCSVRIAEILTASSPFTKGDKTVENPFPYATLFNSSLCEVSLKGGALAPWITTGKQPPEARCFAADAIVIKPRSVAVVWDRSACPELTVEDFNNRYGTTLTEGEDIFPTEVHFLEDTGFSMRLDLRMGDEVVSRAHWNYGTDCPGERIPDKAYEFVYRENRTGTLHFTGIEAATPESVDEEQRGVERVVLPGRHEKKNAKKAEKKDLKAAKRKEKVKITPAEGAGIAIGAAAFAGTAVGAVMKLLGKKEK
ncbi:MAG: CehA/McbA family metallohydrolase [Clostridia bacterium]|nr:CehA/McbA family metallohydrolase [Clostridia bacterium]